MQILMSPKSVMAATAFDSDIGFQRFDVQSGIYVWTKNFIMVGFHRMKIQPNGRRISRYVVSSSRSRFITHKCHNTP